MSGRRVVFMGTPTFAVPSLEGLLALGEDVVLVLSQPDRPAGRGRQPTPPPIAAFARERGLPLFQPPSLKPPEAFARVREARPDVIVVAAYGLILRREVLDVPPLGCLNVHASLLPRHRGAAPIPAAILAGDAEAGVCIMRMEAGLDTGPILACERTPILPSDDTLTLTDRLARLGRDLLVQTLPRWAAGEIAAEPQDDSRATYAPKIERAQARIDWSAPAVEIWRQVRAYRGWPDAFTSWQGKGLKILAARPAPLDLPSPPSPGESSPPNPGEPSPPNPLSRVRERGGTLDAAVTLADVRAVPPGRVVVLDDGGTSRPAVVTGDGALLLDTVVLEGKRPTDAVDLAHGHRTFVGADLGT
ncbi:MAG: methionyl-tRNA formyltransferase [Chloroflexi bacterium]|nr:methionyl-tRNA formyltransferase [Chloroflexota bacterium]